MYSHENNSSFHKYELNFPGWALSNSTLSWCSSIETARLDATTIGYGEGRASAASDAKISSDFAGIAAAALDQAEARHEAAASVADRGASSGIENFDRADPLPETSFNGVSAADENLDILFELGPGETIDGTVEVGAGEGLVLLREGSSIFGEIMIEGSDGDIGVVVRMQTDALLSGNFTIMTGKFEVTNYGAMLGDVYLGDAYGLFDNSKGEVTGTIFSGSGSVHFISGAGPDAFAIYDPGSNTLADILIFDNGADKFENFIFNEDTIQFVLNGEEITITTYEDIIRMGVTIKSDEFGGSFDLEIDQNLLYANFGFPGGGSLEIFSPSPFSEVYHDDFLL